MIKMTYENDETGRGIVVKMTSIDERSVDIDIKFEPDIGDNAPDPYGIMKKVLNAITNETVPGKDEV